jgi:predicted acylesterase/phospholipase RssA
MFAVGLVSSLVQRGVMTRPSQLAGSSAGSLIAASFNAGWCIAVQVAMLVASPLRTWAEQHHDS